MTTLAPWLNDAIAANGQPVSENFRVWFGESQVVGRGGRPLKLWHGSTVVFDAFDFAWSDHFCMHFGSREQASKFKAPRIPLLEVYLAIQNPIRLPDLGMWGFENLARHLDSRGLGLIDGGDYEKAWTANDQNEALRLILLNKGYDGIVYANDVEGAGDSWISFKPEQIKSARNCGLFASGSASLSDAGLAAQLTADNEAAVADQGSTRANNAVGALQWLAARPTTARNNTPSINRP